MQKSFAKHPRPIRLACVSIIQCNLKTTITVLSLLLRNLSTVAVRLLSSLGQIFHAFVRSCPPTVNKVHDSLQVSKGKPNAENSSESLMVVHVLFKSPALQLPAISLCPCTHVIQTSYRLQQQHNGYLQFEAIGVPCKVRSTLPLVLLFRNGCLKIHYPCMINARCMPLFSRLKGAY